MDYDEEKVDEFTLALLFLVVHDRQEGFGARACVMRDALKIFSFEDFRKIEQCEYTEGWARHGKFRR
jgi:hypothetical protein